MFLCNFLSLSFLYYVFLPELFLGVLVRIVDFLACFLIRGTRDGALDRGFMVSSAEPLTPSCMPYGSATGSLNICHIISVTLICNFVASSEIS